jgi:RNA polymerase sigma-70 factor, ECF subfamily
VKAAEASRHPSGIVPAAAIGPTRVPLEDSAGCRALDVSSLHDEHADFVWRTLQRLGVRDADLEDMMQEVFVVVQKRLHTYDRTSKVTTWLFGICMRVAARYRRRAYVRREEPYENVPEGLLEADRAGPEAQVEDRQAREKLARILDEMDLERRAVFVMFELDELGCEEIAAIVGVPVGTVYSRLSAARREFQKIVSRTQAREAHGGPR